MDPFILNDIPYRNKIKIILEFLLFLLRLPFFLGLIIEIIFFNDLIFRRLQVLELHPKIYKVIRVIKLLHNFFIGRLLLLVLGYYNVQPLFNKTVQKNNLQSYSFFCTRTSPLDIFTQITYFSPSFTHISIRKRLVKYQLISYFQAIIDSFYIEKCCFREFDQGKDICELMEQIHKKRTGPLIIFWEGGVSNGQYLLKIDEILIHEACKVNLYAKLNYHKVKYQYSNPSGIFSILVNRRLNLIGKSCNKMLFNLLTNLNIDLEMHFQQLPYYQLTHEKIKGMYNEFIVVNLKRLQSKKNWLDFKKKFVRIIN
ncbi:unnamed protein product [Paramecium sonneborni]|uniref:Uncharacterized protein n=1 Tax=Paramecium sonneborni TaxID=65129 RepID=A0A8S1QHW6_9CILI|nr:unnamed protein product [Paramecium sonneborni]